MKTISKAGRYSSIIGIGLNLNQVTFSPDINPFPCVRSVEDPRQDTVMKDILNSFIKRYSEFATIQILFSSSTNTMPTSIATGVCTAIGMKTALASFHSVEPEGIYTKVTAALGNMHLKGGICYLTHEVIHPMKPDPFSMQQGYSSLFPTKSATFIKLQLLRVSS